MHPLDDIEWALHDNAPSDVLCMTVRDDGVAGSCSACCGTYNFHDRSPAAERLRLRRRTKTVRAAGSDPSALTNARDTLLAIEQSERISDAIPSCPFVTYLDEAESTAGCFLHPSRHPHGEDLRDLGVYPQKVCAGHYCAPHDWLTDSERMFVRAVEGTLYGRVVVDAALVRCVKSMLEDVLGRTVDARHLATHAQKVHVHEFYRWLLDAESTDDESSDVGPPARALFLQHRDETMGRIGASILHADGTETRASIGTLNDEGPLTPNERDIFLALGLSFSSTTDVESACSELRARIGTLARELERFRRHGLVPLGRSHTSSSRTEGT